VDSDHSGEISFSEFIEWQKEAIYHSKISHTTLVGLVQQLSCLLGDVLELSGMKRKQETMTAETIGKDPLLRAILPKVATCTRELWRRKASKDSTVSGDKARSSAALDWPPLPEGIDTQKLVRRHLQDPVPTVGVKRIDVRIHSILPDLTGEHGLRGEPPRWLAKVVRSIAYKDGKHEVIQFYYCYRAKAWTAVATRDEFCQALMLLPHELRLYSLLLAEADFGESLRWPQIQLVMEDAEKMGLVTKEESLEFSIYLEKVIARGLEKKQLRKDRAADFEKRKDLLATLMPEASFSPIEVMQTLSACGIMPVHPLWAV